MVTAQIKLIPAHFVYVTIYESEPSICDAYVRIITMPFHYKEISLLRDVFRLYEVECVDILHTDSPAYIKMAKDVLEALEGRPPRGTVKQLELWPL